MTGKKRGRLLGFPTANIPLHKKIPEGIYASLIVIDGMIFKSATFIGSAETFNENDYKAESYIFDFNKDIYGKWVKITLIRKIRNNEKFKTENELVIQMKRDIKDAKSILSEYIHVF